jgi:hypothetical protein
MNATGELLIPLENFMAPRHSSAAQQPAGMASEPMDIEPKESAVELPATKSIDALAENTTERLADNKQQPTAHPESEADGVNNRGTGEEVLLDSLVLRIEFSLKRSRIGAFFMTADAEHPNVSVILKQLSID